MSTDNKNDISVPLVLYKVAFSKANQEGDGVWSRFNFLMSINLALAGGYLYIAKDATEKQWLVCLAISFLGVAVTVFTKVIINRLFVYQNHWVAKAKRIEEILSTDVEVWGRVLRDGGPAGVSVRKWISWFILLIYLSWLVAATVSASFIVNPLGFIGNV